MKYRPPTFAQETCLWDEFVILVAGMGLGVFLPASGFIFFFALGAALYWTYLKFHRYIDYRRDYYE